MLILERCASEEVFLDKQTRVVVLSTTADSVKLEVTAPRAASLRKVTPQDSLDCEPVLVSDLETVDS